MGIQTPTEIAELSLRTPRPVAILSVRKRSDSYNYAKAKLIAVQNLLRYKTANKALRGAVSLEMVSDGTAPYSYHSRNE